MRIGGLMRRLCRAALPALFLVLFPALLLGGCHGTAEPVSETRRLLDTVCTVTLYQPADRALLTQVLDLCAEYEALLSRTAKGSDVWHVNHAGGAPRDVDPRTAELIRLGIEYGDLSGGLFDITIGRVSALWDFGGAPAVPSDGALAAAADTVDYRRVVLDGNSVSLQHPEAWLDLGGIAKGYIADRMADFLREHGEVCAIIDLGGNILTVGTKPGGAPWRIGLEQPFSDRRRLIGRLNVEEASVVTAGIYERQFTENGVRYHHILDPRSGFPAESDVVSAAVVTKHSAVGDALSTLLVLSGSGEAEALLARTPDLMGAVLVLQSGEIVPYGDIVFEPERGEAREK